MACCIDIIIGIFILIYIISVNIISGSTIAFDLPFIIVGVLLILYYFIRKFSVKSQFFRVLKKLIIIISCISLSFFIIIESFIIGFPKINKEDTDYIIVLGDKLKSGNNITKTLRDRLDIAVKSIYNDGDNGHIVLSGGRGRNENISEADVMERYLIDQGVPKNKIIKEEKSTNIYENLENSKLLIEKHSGKKISSLSIKIVTTNYEALRSNLIALKYGYKDIKFNTSNELLYLIPAYYTIEAFELVKNLFFIEIATIK